MKRAAQEIARDPARMRDAEREGPSRFTERAAPIWTSRREPTARGSACRSRFAGLDAVRRSFHCKRAGPAGPLRPVALAGCATGGPGYAHYWKTKCLEPLFRLMTAKSRRGLSREGRRFFQNIRNPTITPSASCSPIESGKQHRMFRPVRSERGPTARTAIPFQLIENTREKY